MRRTAALLMIAGVALTACRGTPPVPAPAPEPRVDARELEARLAAMAARIDTLVARLELLTAQNDSLRRSTSRMESEVKDKEDQIRAIRLELQRLKEIDLKPRPRPAS